jgi:hypothetical protein
VDAENSSLKTVCDELAQFLHRGRKFQNLFSPAKEIALKLIFAQDEELLF